ncbi:MAG: hypothetical protein ACOCP4_04910 [Candidatus Woesearchaeota archaeon]
MAEKGVKRTLFLVLIENQNIFMTSKEVYEKMHERTKKKICYKSVKDILSSAYKKGLVERAIYKIGYRKYNIKPVRIIEKNYENWRGVT